MICRSDRVHGAPNQAPPPAVQRTSQEPEPRRGGDRLAAREWPGPSPGLGHSHRHGEPSSSRGAALPAAARAQAPEPSPRAGGGPGPRATACDGLGGPNDLNAPPPSGRRGRAPAALPPGALVRVTVPPTRPRARLRRGADGTLSLFGGDRGSPDDARPGVVTWLESVGLVVRRVGRQGARLRVEAVAPCPEDEEALRGV